MNQFGVYSEVGRLRKVMVHRPELSLRRLTPENHDELLFDDIIWVDRAMEEHDAFTKIMKDEGVQVFYLKELLAETFDVNPNARQHAISRMVNEMTVGVSAVDSLRLYLMELEPEELARCLIGGLTVGEVGTPNQGELFRRSLTASSAGTETFILPPLPNTLFTRDSSCWIYNGVTVNPMYWPARRPESSTLLLSTEVIPCSPMPGSSTGIPRLPAGKLLTWQTLGVRP